MRRRSIGYAAIMFAGESSLRPMPGKRIVVRIGRNSRVLLARYDPGAFFADVAMHAPHPMRRGAALETG